MIKIAMVGAAGRMGKAILRLASEDKNFGIGGGLESKDHPQIGTDLGDLIGQKAMGLKLTSDCDAVFSNADVIIDFTHASAVEHTLQFVTKYKKPYVLGTTNLDAAVLKKLKDLSKSVPIIQSPNMSVGVNLLLELCVLAGKVLDESYDVEIAEIHHRAKKDSPSGTAMKLLDVIAQVRRKNTEKDTVFGRKGDIGIRPKGQLGVLALRGGDVVGDHTVYFLGDGERVELTHRLSSRDALAKGALVAAKFLVKQKSGMFDMRQVLGIS